MEKSRCLTCRHYFVTWHPKTPRGCRAYRFESAQIPCLVVERETGVPCQAHEPRQSSKRFDQWEEGEESG